MLIFDKISFQKVPWGEFRQKFLSWAGIASPETLVQLEGKIHRLENEVATWDHRFEKKALEKVRLQQKQARHQRVLLMDTETENFDLLREILPKNFELRMVKSWDQIFAETRKAFIPLLVVDMALLGANGVEHLTQLKSKNPRLKVVALSSYLGGVLVQAMPEKLKFAAVLQKPLSEERVRPSLLKQLPKA